MMTKEEIIDKHVKNIKRTTCWWPEQVYNGRGGQTVSVSPTGIYLESEETGFCIFINSQRSQIKNYELGITLFKLFLEETIKP